MIYFIACTPSKKIVSGHKINVSATDSLEGLRLISQNDCFTCDSLTRRFTGPSYFSISSKYNLTSENLLKLSAKIISGGEGIWGKVPMTPHNTLSQTGAENIVKYILSRKK